MSKKPYELTFIVRLDPDESVMNGAIDQVKAWVEENEHGTVTKVDRWGRRRLAYEIDRQREGYYVLFNAEIEPHAIPELERNLNLAPAILRYLLIRSDN